MSSNDTVWPHSDPWGWDGCSSWMDGWIRCSFSRTDCFYLLRLSSVCLCGCVTRRSCRIDASGCCQQNMVSTSTFGRRQTCQVSLMLENANIIISCFLAGYWEGETKQNITIHRKAIVLFFSDDFPCVKCLSLNRLVLLISKQDFRWFHLWHAFELFLCNNNKNISYVFCSLFVLYSFITDNNEVIIQICLNVFI